MRYVYFSIYWIAHAHTQIFDVAFFAVVCLFVRTTPTQCARVKNVNAVVAFCCCCYFILVRMRRMLTLHIDIFAAWLNLHALTVQQTIYTHTYTAKHVKQWLVASLLKCKAIPYKRKIIRRMS